MKVALRPSAAHSLLLAIALCCDVQAQSSDPGAAPSSPVKHDLSFAQHASLDFQLKITKEEGQRIARSISKLLQAAQGNLGAMCNVELALQSEIGRFFEHEIPFSIRGETDFEAARAHALRTTFTAFIVDRIQWCGAIRGGKIYGCSDEPGRLMLIVSPKLPALQGALGNILVVHELMHTSGSPHNPKTNYLLYEDLTKAGPGRTTAECHQLVTNLGGRFVPPAPLAIAELRNKKKDLPTEGEQLRAPDKIDLSTASKKGGSDGASLGSVSDFVETFWIHGVPYNQARKFSESDAENLIKRLGAETNESVRANIVSTLGAIGSKAAVDTLTGIVLSKRGAQLSSEEYGTKAEAMIALAWSSSKRPGAAELLLNGLQPEFWAREGKWRRQGRSSQQVAEDLAKDAALALALVGTPAARQALKAAAERAEQEAEGARVKVEETTTKLKQLEGHPRTNALKDSVRILSGQIDDARGREAQKHKQKRFYESMLKEAEQASEGLENYYKN